MIVLILVLWDSCRGMLCWWLFGLACVLVHGFKDVLCYLHGAFFVQMNSVSLIHTVEECCAEISEHMFRYVDEHCSWVVPHHCFHQIIEFAVVMFAGAVCSG